MTPVEANGAIEAACRIESARLIATLTRIVRDVGLAEELAQDAFVAALEQWPLSGVPYNTGAWLMTAAKRRAIDRLRRDQRMQRKFEALGVALERLQENVDLAAEADEIDDDVLRLIFIACHPTLSREAQVALTLRLIGGLTTEEIARAFLVSEATVAQRIVRAKRTLAAARAPFEVPVGTERNERLAAVLEVTYLIFNEGYSATAGTSWTRPELCAEGLRLGRMLSELEPSEAEVHSLAALMEIQASRLRARIGPGGEPILLFDQDRTKWDALLIRRGLAALERAVKLGKGLGPYGIQAAIAACHARARTPEETDWAQIVALYDGLVQLQPSPIVELNRAIAIGMLSGPQASLQILDSLIEVPSLRNYHLLPSVRGQFLRQLGRHHEARREFERAASLTRNTRERELLLKRAAETVRE